MIFQKDICIFIVFDNITSSGFDSYAQFINVLNQSRI